MRLHVVAIALTAVMLMVMFVPTHRRRMMMKMMKMVMLTIMVGPTHRRRPHYVRECQARQQTLPLPTTNDRTNMKKTNYQE